MAKRKIPDAVVIVSIIIVQEQNVHFIVCDWNLVDDCVRRMRSR